MAIKEWVKAFVSNTPSRYRFTLISPDGILVLKNSPLEWKDGVLEYERKIKAGGVFINFALDSLTFIKEGYNFLKGLKETYGINATCSLKIEEFNGETREYEEFPVQFACIFSTYSAVKVGDTKIQIAVNIQIQNSSELVNFENRKGVDVDLTKTTSIGGYEIVDYPHSLVDSNPLGYEIFKKYINYPASNIIDTSQSRTPSIDYGLPRLPGSISYCSVPVDTLLSDFSEITAVPYATQKTNLNDIQSIFDTALYDYDFTFDYVFIIDVRDKDSTNAWSIKLIEVDSGGSIQSEKLIETFGTEKRGYVFSDSFNISIDQGNSFKLVVEVQDRADLSAYLMDQLTTAGVTYYSEVFFKQTVTSTPARTVDCFPKYEFFERICQHIFDSQFPFYSEKYGRTDVIYNFDEDKYLSEDQKTFAGIQSGLNIRGGFLRDENIPLAISFKKAFDSINTMDNIGYTFEFIDGFNRLRIEDYSFFFQDDVVLDLSDRINELDLEGEMMPELAYVKLVSGFKKYDYEEINGRGEFNTESQRTTINKVDTEFNNVSDIRGDTKGIYKLISQPLDTTGTTDEKGDNELFITKTQRDGVNWWKPEKEENITIENNSSIFGDSTLNLFYTPTRNLIRHGNKLKSPLIKYTSSKLLFQTSEKLQTLRTTGEGYSISENEDILVDDLSDPIFDIEIITATIKLTFAERKALMAAPLKRIIFTDSISGWLMKYRQKNAEDKVEISIIKKYVS